MAEKNDGELFVLKEMMKYCGQKCWGWHLFLKAACIGKHTQSMDHFLSGVCFHRKYNQALEYHRQALVLIPQHASTYSSIGYVHSLMGDFESAIDYFHTVKSIHHTHSDIWPVYTMKYSDFLYSQILVSLLQALGLKRDDTFSVTMLGHCIEMYIGDTDAYIGMTWLIFKG